MVVNIDIELSNSGERERAAGKKRKLLRVVLGVS